MALFLTETQIRPPRNITYLNFPGYIFFNNFRAKAGVCAFIRSDVKVSAISDLNCDDSSFQTLFLHLHVGQHSSSVGVVYRSPNSSADVEFFRHLNEACEHLLSKYPSSEIMLLGNFNVHHEEWLQSTRTDDAGRELEAFAIINDLQQLVTSPTRIPDRQDQSANILDLFLTTHPFLYSDITVNAPLGRSDHNIICVSSVHGITSTPAPPKRRLWKFKDAQWDELRDFFAQFPWEQMLNNINITDTNSDIEVDSYSSLITDVILDGMHAFIPSSLTPGKKNSPKWFTAACAVAVSEKISFFINTKQILQVLLMMPTSKSGMPAQPL